MTLDEAIKRFESIKLYKNFEEFIKDCGDSRVKDGVKICDIFCQMNWMNQ